MQFLTDNYMLIIMALLAISEVLALIPGIKSKSVFQLIYNFLKGVVEAKKPEEKKPE